VNADFKADFETLRSLCVQVASEEPQRLGPQRPVWIFGAGQFGRDVCAVLLDAGFAVVGFIETTPREQTVLGLPVVSWTQLEPEQVKAQLVVGIFNRGMPLDQLAELATAAGFTEILMPWDIYAQFGGRLGWRFWLSGPEVILDNLPAIEQTFHALGDDESRRCLLQICAFRLGRNLGYASFSNDEPQYFNALTLDSLAGKPIDYVDGGAYNGDTFHELANQVEVGNAWLFEPDPENFAALAKAARGMQARSVCLPLAVADAYRILSFSGGNGEGGTISDDGTVRIAAVALDDVLPTQRVDFIKLDVEGAEIQALRGAAQLIQRSRPVLAISLYHRPQDIWEIPEQLSALCPNYKFYIRQHYYNSFDSVLYAVPERASPA
jgi:FkbM family methyltransferase